jgi:heme/copper-type cytochrome/quinol oxidase subunit 3
MMKRPPVPDAEAIPDRGFVLHPPIWWGNTLMLLMEGAGLAILVATYFYLRRNVDTWPPPRTPLPDLGISTINLIVLVVSILPMWYAAQLALKQDRPKVLACCLLLCVLFGIAAAILRVLEFKGVHTHFGANVYGSIVWSILAVHFAHIISATLETLVLGIPMFRGPVEEKQFVDVTANAVYWYFVGLSWVGLYAIVFLAPRFL